MTNKKRLFFFTLLLLLIVFLSFGEKVLGAGEYCPNNDDSWCATCERCIDWVCTPLNCQTTCQTCFNHRCVGGCGACQTCNSGTGQCVDECKSCEACINGKCVDDCSGCQLCKWGSGGYQCRDQDSECETGQTCESGQCEPGCKCVSPKNGYCIEYFGGDSCDFGAVMWRCATYNGEHDCFFPNNAKLGDRCGSNDCYDIDDPLTYYCGYESQCSGANCDADDPECAVTPAYECASGDCAAFCGYARTQIIYCPNPTSGVLEHCGDTCVEAPFDCAGQGNCPSPTSAGGPSNTPTPTRTPTPTPTNTPSPTPTRTPTPTPPLCSLSRSPLGGCFGPTNQPGFSGVYGGGADEVSFFVDDEPSLYAPRNCSSGYQVSTAYGYPSCSLSTNVTGTPYYWSAMTRDTNTPKTCTQTDPNNPTPIAFSVDTTDPTPPTVATCSQSGGNVTCSWTASHDDGCLDCTGGYACKYWLQGYYQGPTPPTGSTPTPIWQVNDGEWAPSNVSAPSYSASCAGYDGLFYYFNVRQAKDDYAIVGSPNSDNESTIVTALASARCPTPTILPTINVTGVLQQQSNNACYQASSSQPFPIVTLIITPPANSCTTPAPACSLIGNWAYSCNVVFNNQSCFAPTPSGTLRIYARAANSDPGAWGPTPVGTTCGATSSTVGYDLSASTVISKDIIFSATTDSWVKLKSSSYWTSSPTKINYLPPAIINPYDSDDTSDKYFIIGGATPGPAGQDSGTGLGITTCSTDDCYSDPHDWHDEGKSYEAGFSFTPSQYLDYVKSMKEYKVITNFGASEIDSANKIYLIKGNQTVSVADFGRDKIVIIIANSAGTGLGTVTINGSANSFNTANSHSLAIIADQIVFSNSLTEARGLFIANTINTGSNSNQGLKINGNLVAVDTFTNNRSRSDSSKPTIFVINNYKMYIDLLPYLSKSIYDWRQLQ